MNTADPQIPTQQPPVIKGKSFFQKYRLPLGILFVIFVVSWLIFWLNYFRIINIPLLLQKESKFALVIDGKKITTKEYNDVFNYVNFNLKDEEASRVRTNSLFIENELLKRESSIENIASEAFVDSQNLASAGQRLEMENAFLKEQLFDKSLSWYSGEYFAVRFENPELDIPQEEKNNRARAKIEEVRKYLLDGREFTELVSKYSADEEMNLLNANQGFAGKFEKMNLGKPDLAAPEFTEAIQNLRPGEVSDVITLSGPGTGQHPGVNPFAYAVIKLTASKTGIASSFNEWLEKAKSETKIEILVK